MEMKQIAYDRPYLTETIKCRAKHRRRIGYRTTRTANRTAAALHSDLFKSLEAGFKAESKVYQLCITTVFADRRLGAPRGECTWRTSHMLLGWKLDAMPRPGICVFAVFIEKTPLRHFNWALSV